MVPVSVLGIVVGAAPWWIAVGGALGGARMVRLGAAGPWIGAVGLGVVTYVVVRGVVGAMAWATVNGRRGALAIAGAVIGIGCAVVDARAWHRLYPALHGLVLGAEFGAFAVAAAAFARPMRRPIVVGAALLALGPGSFLLQRWSQNVRFVAQQQTAATRQLLALAPRRPTFPGPSPSPGPSPGPTRRPAPASPPISSDAHLVLITVDALRPDHLGAWGYPRRVNGEPLSPTVDGLAARGVRFARTYSQAPHSAYSIASLLASDYVSSTVQLGAPLPPTLADVLAARGFRTEAWFPIGLFFNGRRELAAYAERRFGFQASDVRDLDARALTDAVLARLDEIRRDGEPRTFFWIHYFDVHEPYLRHPEYDLGGAPAARYDSEIAYFDRQLARLLAAFAQLDRPTVIALTADHGEEFKEHGGWYHGSSLYEEQVRVPLIVVAPGLQPRVVDDPVELVDVAPMLLGLLGEAPAPSMRGDDLAAALVGAPLAPRPVFSEVEQKRMTVEDGFKLVHDFRRDTWELYDLARDPRETVNLYDARPETARALAGELHRFLENLRDPSTREPVALTMARLGDQRAVPGLAQVIADATQPPSVRAEAARLAGALEGYAAKQALRDQLPLGIGKLPPGSPLTPVPPGTPCDAVCAESALALGELTDRRAQETLVRLLDEPRFRRRAAVMLGRLRDPRAVDGLIEAIADPDVELRRQAVHYLGFVGDARAIAPLAARLPDLRSRYLVALALARVGARTGDRTVGPLLLEWLAKETYEDDRAHFICALGLLGDRSPAAVAAARDAALADPPVKWATETLVRLGALEETSSGVSGVDFAPRARGLAGPFLCGRRDGDEADQYAGATTCTLLGAGTVRFPIAHPADGEIALRVSPTADGARLTVAVNGRPLAVPPLGPGWRELRIPAPASLWRSGDNEVALAGSVELDHLLVLPRTRARVGR